jgi:3-hydroxyacyl-CoA dehydrogenase
MGAGIAAQIANAGVPVLLLDLPPASGGGGRNAVAEAAVARMLAAGAGPFMHPDAAKLVQTGNIDDDLPHLAECDWIVEAIVERLEVKQALYRRIEAVRRPGAAVTSNTSTIALARLVEGMPEAFARDCLITHFFNPPRQMRLLELVTGPQTDPGLAARLRHFIDAGLGKTVVDCHDSPGFIANRIGAYWMLLGLAQALDLGVSVEAADAVMGKPLGIPSTGIFGLMDLVGLDVMADIAASLAAALPEGDPFHRANQATPLLQRLIAEGRTGRKGKGGFYRLDRASGRGKEALDLASGDYRPAETQAPSEIAAAGRDVQALLGAPGPVGAFAWGVMGRTLAYAAALVPGAADSIEAIDTAMRLGYNWQQGPFELIDRLGAAWVAERMARDGVAVPKLLQAPQPFYRVEAGRRQAMGLEGAYRAIARPDGVLLLADIRLAAKPLLQTASGALWDIGDGVACFEATTKLGTFDPGVFALLHQAIALVTERFRALVLYNEGSHFSAGANLGLVLSGDAEALVLDGQRAFKALKYAPFPVVAAPFGLALGGGCEVVLNADAVQAHAELSIGLVECNVGLIPGWGGCGEILARVPDAGAVFDLIRSARVSTSAADARALGYLRPTDGITMNRDRLLADAKARALALADGYTPPVPPEFAGCDAAALVGRIPASSTAHDRIVAEALAHVLGGGGSEERLLHLECEEFVALARMPPTVARIEHILRTGKPLRN